MNIVGDLFKSECIPLINRINLLYTGAVLSKLIRRRWISQQGIDFHW